MRIVALLALVFLLAGCTQNSPTNGGPAGDFASCPSWVKGQSGYQVRDDGAMTYTADNAATYYMPPPDGNYERWDLKAPNATTPGSGIGTGLQTFQGYPLDQLVFDFRPETSNLTAAKQLLYIQDGELTLEFLADEGGSPGQVLRAYDQARGPSSARDSWVFASDPVKKFAFHNITLRLDLAQPDEDPNPRGVFLHWTMTKVNLDNDFDTTTMELIRYNPQLWYRTCSSDGTRL